jgi:hypothetical protein
MFDMDRRLHALTVLNLFFCYAALGQPERAHRLLLSEGLPKVDDNLVLTDIHYFLGMLYARFLKERDLDRATVHLEQALALIPRLDASEARRDFLNVFVRNGLAYVRFRQGRADAARWSCVRLDSRSSKRTCDRISTVSTARCCCTTPRRS